MNIYKTFEELKEELGDKYDKFMYDMNLELVKQKEKAIEYIKSNLDNTGWLEIGSQDVEVLINLLQGSDE